MGTGGDRLSDLPECLLHGILSHLKARQVVQTCVLSRRWERVWRSVPCLHIDFRDFGSRPDDDEDVLWATLAVFEDFADNLLCSRSASPLDTFRLDAGKMNCNRLPACRWVRRALKHYSPAVLHVSSGSDSKYDEVVLPSLVPGSHRLTRLYLHKVGLDSGDENQFASASGFPVLEVLDLRGGSYSLRRIESATLKSLTICDCNNCIRENIVIAAPSLTSLRLRLPFRRESNSRCFYATGFTVHESPSLVTASISVMDIDQYNTHTVDKVTLKGQSLFRTLRKLLGSISNVSSLDLSGFKTTSGERPFILLYEVKRLLGWRLTEYIPSGMYEDIALEFDQFTSPVHLLQAVLDDARGNFPVFRNLTTLVLDECYMSTNLQTLWRFLLHTPILGKLTLQCCKFPDGTRREEKRSISNRVPDHLTKLVDIKCNDTNEDDHDTVPKLKLVEIKYKERDEGGLHVALQEMYMKYKDQETQERETVASEISKKLPKTTVQVTMSS
ncbi:unnamed protein product [Alopecurus aequalis]